METGRHCMNKRREKLIRQDINLSKLLISLLFLKVVLVNLTPKNNNRLLENYFSEIHLVIQGTGEVMQKFISDSFSFMPSEVIVNGERATACENTYQCNLGITKNNMTLKFDDQINSLKELFDNVRKIIEIDLSHFDSSHVTTMEKMFNKCIDLEKINFKNINTSSVESMNRLFRECSSLTSIDVSNFDTTKVISMSNMFAECWSLEALDLSNFDNPNLKDTSFMFEDCYRLQYLNLSSFDTSGVTYMYGMFSGCSNAKYIDLQILIVRVPIQ